MYMSLRNKGLYSIRRKYTELRCRFTVHTSIYLLILQPTYRIAIPPPSNIWSSQLCINFIPLFYVMKSCYFRSSNRKSRHGFLKSKCNFPSPNDSLKNQLPKLCFGRGVACSLNLKQRHEPYLESSHSCKN